MAAELSDYIAKAKKRDLTDEQIKTKLLSIGWPEEEVKAALAHDAELPVPLPPTISHVGMWTGFLYILFFISLYVLATAVGGILHTWVDKAVPSVVSSNGDFSANDLSFFFFDAPTVTRGYLAAIIVSYPLFLVLALVLKKQLVTQPLVRNLRSRKLLIYITLVITFLIMLGNIVTTCYNFLAGTITGNGLGHVAVTLLLTGGIFWYFISEVKNDRKIN